MKPKNPDFPVHKNLSSFFSIPSATYENSQIILHNARLLSYQEKENAPNMSTPAANDPTFYSSILYAARDFIRPGEDEEYARTLNSLLDELTPEGPLEQTFALEIVGATWRLRRCRLVEDAFASIDNLNFDAMTDDRTEKQQKTIDRARAQSHLIIRRSIAELRKLQTNRTIRQQRTGDEIPVLTDLKQVAIVLKTRNQANSKNPGTRPKTEAGRIKWDVVWVPDFDHSTAVKCPCGSTAYFEYCCGKKAA